MLLFNLEKVVIEGKQSKRKQNKIQNAFNNYSSLNSLGLQFDFPSLFAAWVQQTPTDSHLMNPEALITLTDPYGGHADISDTSDGAAEDHQLNCPLRGCGWRTEHSSCLPRLVSHQAAAAPRCSSELSIAVLQFLRYCCGFALHQNLFFTTFRRMDTNYTAGGGQLGVSCRSVKSKEEASIPHSCQSQHCWSNGQPAANPTDSTGVSTLGTWADTH